MSCPKCGAQASGKFCFECGAPLADPTASGATDGGTCTACGAGLEEGALFCAECGTPAGKRPRKPLAAYLPWAISGVALVAFAVAIALFIRGQAAPRIGDMPVTGGLPEAPRGEPGGGMVDLSQMSPREAADRLFERSMQTEAEGNRERAQFFANMAVQAYDAVPPEQIDGDARFHLGLLHLLQGQIDQAQAEVDALRETRPDHLLALIVQGRIHAARGEAEAEAATLARYLSVFEGERAAGLPEYEAHVTLMDAEAERARGAVGG
ncbi:MAG: zinc ribbon domain-containing protein [Gemmatimonadota bacterium]|nr:zinc ribbon domain-containing protein [Gemmatimonadota bacterium]